MTYSSSSPIESNSPVQLLPSTIPGSSCQARVVHCHATSQPLFLLCRAIQIRLTVTQLVSFTVKGGRIKQLSLSVSSKQPSPPERNTKRSVYQTKTQPNLTKPRLRPILIRFVIREAACLIQLWGVVSLSIRIGTAPRRPGNEYQVLGIPWHISSRLHLQVFSSGKTRPWDGRDPSEILTRQHSHTSGSFSSSFFRPSICMRLSLFRYRSYNQGSAVCPATST